MSAITGKTTQDYDDAFFAWAVAGWFALEIGLFVLAFALEVWQWRYLAMGSYLTLILVPILVGLWADRDASQKPALALAPAA